MRRILNLMYKVPVWVIIPIWYVGATKNNPWILLFCTALTLGIIVAENVERKEGIASALITSSLALWLIWIPYLSYILYG